MISLDYIMFTLQAYYYKIFRKSIYNFEFFERGRWKWGVFMILKIYTSTIYLTNHYWFLGVPSWALEILGLRLSYIKKKIQNFL